MTSAGRHLLNVLSAARLNLLTERTSRFGMEPLEEIAEFIERNMPSLFGSGPINLNSLQIPVRRRRRGERPSDMEQLISYYNYLVVMASNYLNKQPGQDETFIV